MGTKFWNFCWFYENLNKNGILKSLKSRIYENGKKENKLEKQRRIKNKNRNRIEKNLETGRPNLWRHVWNSYYLSPYAVNNVSQMHVQEINELALLGRSVRGPRIKFRTKLFFFPDRWTHKNLIPPWIIFFPVMNGWKNRRNTPLLY